jgi:hypothetical protein
MYKLITVYCEGKSGSPDYDVLSKVFDGLNITIKPIGGKTGAGSIMNFNEEHSIEGKSNFYTLFRDRDFDIQIPDKEELAFDGKRTYFSYRTTIENYFFNVSKFYQFILSKGLAVKYRILDEADIKKIFIQAAKKIKYYQAIRHTMGKLREPTDFGTTWTEGSGHLPVELNENYCREKALDCIKGSKSKTVNWSEEKFDQILNSFLNKFDELFFDKLDFLIWFQGKDFASSLKNELPEFPLKSYYSFAKKNFDYTNFIDLIELRTIIEKQLD